MTLRALQITILLLLLLLLSLRCASITRRDVEKRTAHHCWCARVMGFHPANFGLPGISVFELGRGTGQTDIRTDGRTDG